MSSFNTSVSFDRSVIERIDEAAFRRGLSRSALIKTAVAEYLDGPLSPRSFRRLLSVTEWMQAALDVILDENAPERRNDVLKAVAERMEKFHDAR